MMEYDFLQPSKRKTTFVDHLKSGVPVLSDHYKNSLTHSTASLSTEKTYQKSNENNSRKRLDGFGKILNQRNFSKIDNMYANSGGESFKAFPSVTEGRSRMFHKSQIF